jgi:perosamine synthetase
MKLSLIPRLNYNFSFRNLIVSFIGILRTNICAEKLSKLFNNDDIYFTNHARTGLRLLLNSFNLPSNAKIGVQIINCQTVFNAIVNAGYQPIFIDINESLTISLEDLQKKSKQIDALIATHIFGIPAKIEKIKDIMRGKPIIEDCAHSFLSTKNGELTGTFSDAAIFSFGKGKFPSIGQGGFVVINNKTILPKFMEKFSELKENNYYDEIKNILESILLQIFHNRLLYRFVTYPIIKKIEKKLNIKRNYQSVEKKVLKSNQSAFLDSIILSESKKERQHTNALRLIEKLKIYDNITPINIDDDSRPNYIMLPVFTNDKKKLINIFFNMGLEIGTHFYKSLEWAGELGYVKNDCKRAERIIKQLVLLPTYTSFN